MGKFKERDYISINLVQRIIGIKNWREFIILLNKNIRIRAEK